MPGGPTRADAGDSATTSETEPQSQVTRVRVIGVPFTISHVAVAGPLNRLVNQQLPVLALAVGTMSPDLEFFLRGRIERSIGHTVHGILLLDVPLSFAFLAALSWLIIPAITTLLPDAALHLGAPLERTFTLPRAAWTDRRALARITLAVMIGAGSHILWDQFTHNPGADEVALGWLDWLPFSIGEADFALHSIFQWLSTALGLTLVMRSLNRWLDTQPREIPAEALLEPTPSAIRKLGWAFVGIVTVGFAVQNPLAFLGTGGGRPTGLANLLAHSAIWSLSGCFIALSLFGAAIQMGLVERWVSSEPGPNTSVG